MSESKPWLNEAATNSFAKFSSPFLIVQLMAIEAARALLDPIPSALIKLWFPDQPLS